MDKGGGESANTQGRANTLRTSQPTPNCILNSQ